MVVNLTYELQKDDLITWIPLKDIYFSKFHYSQNFGKLGLCGCPGTLLDSNNQKIGIENTLKILKNHHIDIIVSLLEISELKSLGCDNLIKEIKLNNFVWFHFPIIDFNIPTKNSLLKLNLLLSDLERFLKEEKNIIIHCKAGLGRTGTIASLLLAKLGISTKDAVQYIRKYRPGSIDTDEQKNFVLNWKN
jgi:protein-tyrosine phosphatase|tara:strand:- start:435 stop:1007 length:573 start_codon:yes stop_codon:yes gene_type:complete